MKVEGKLIAPKRGEKHWAIEIPAIEVYTQGTSRKNALKMAADGIEALVGRRGFKAIVEESGGETFTVSAENLEVFLAFVLARMRSARSLTTREVASRLNSSSPNAYARYEQGKAMPRLDTFEALIHAIDPRMNIVLRVG